MTISCAVADPHINMLLPQMQTHSVDRHGRNGTELSHVAKQHFKCHKHILPKNFSQYPSASCDMNIGLAIKKLRAATRNFPVTTLGKSFTPGCLHRHSHDILANLYHYHWNSWPTLRPIIALHLFPSSDSWTQRYHSTDRN